MSSSTAQAAKDKGNAAFKAADYPAAIGHYTQAILSDPNEPTFYLNRAAAYLKLGKNEDAERDSTAVLRLDKGNVKALYRRAQARLAIGGKDKISLAEKDLKEALVSDSSNAAVKAELERIPRSTAPPAQRNADPSPSNNGRARVTIETVSNTPNDVNPPNVNRRRVPIKIVDDPAGTSALSAPSTSTSIPATSPPLKSAMKPSSTPSNGLLNPVSTRQLTTSSKPSSPPASPGPTPTPTPAPPPPLTSTPSAPPPSNPAPTTQHKVGGGIFRHSGSKYTHSTLRSAPSPGANSTGIPSLYDFTREWNNISGGRERWDLLQRSVPPQSLPLLFKSSLDAAFLRSVLETFLVVLSITPDSQSDIQEYMNAFPQVERFGLVVMLMSEKDREFVRTALEVIGVPKEEWKV